jgi:hypothetical protein
MTQYKRIAIDTSKAVFTLHGIDQQDRPMLRANLRRAQLIPFFKKLPATVIAIEACSSFHHWAALLHGSANRSQYSQHSVNYAMRMERGRPKSNIRFMTCTATVTSVARRSSFRKRSASPITCLYRPIVASTRLRLL